MPRTRLPLLLLLASALLLALAPLGCARRRQKHKKRPRREPPRREQPAERPEPSAPPEIQPEPPAPPRSDGEERPPRSQPLPSPAGPLPDPENTRDWFEMRIDTLDGSPSPVHIGRLLQDGPAGAHGFVTVRGDRFVFEDGTPCRFWGTNLGRDAVAPPKDLAPKIAERLFRLGFNCVRFHLIDTGNMLFQGQRNSLSFNTKLLDRMDFFVAELKERGIYVDLNLHVWRHYKDGDPIPTPRQVPQAGKWINYFHPQVIAFEKGYIRRLLGHVNPYTKLSYAQDPVLALVELTNENSLLVAWAQGFLNKKKQGRKSLTQPYLDWLDQDFNRWLLQRHGSREALARAWQGGRRGLRNDEDPTRGTVQRISGSALKSASPQRVSDTLLYYQHLESGWIASMRDFMRKELGLEVPVLGSQLYHGLPSLQAQATADYLDSHAYWDHPYYENQRDKDNSPIRLHLQSWVDHPLGVQNRKGREQESPLFVVDLSSVAGKPHTHSEWNTSQASPWTYELPILIGAYDAFSGIDGLYSFIYAGRASDYQSSAPASLFQFANDAPMLTTNTVAALAFRRGDVEEAREKIRLHYTQEQILDLSHAYDGSMSWWGKRVPSWIPYVIPVERVFRGGADEGPLELLRQPDPKRYAANTGELIWDARSPATAVVTIDTPRYQAVVGRLGSQRLSALAVDGKMHAAVALISLDGQPLRQSRHALLAAVGRGDYQGESLRQDGDWQRWQRGRLPLRAQPVVVTVQLPEWTAGPDLHAYALDAQGARIAEIPITQDSGGPVLQLGNAQALWYEILAESSGN